MKQVIFLQYDRNERKMVEVDPAQAASGSIVSKRFFCNSAGTYVSVPGDCIYRVTSAGLANED